MDSVVRFDLLARLGEVHGKRARGKILQRLLELAFVSIGYRLIDERISEGTDFDVMRGGREGDCYSFEARTTERDSVLVKNEDLRQMDARARDGYQTGLAALRISPGSRWAFVNRSLLLPPSFRLSVGTCYEWEALGQEVNEAFDATLICEGALAISHGLDGLAPQITRAVRSPNLAMSRRELVSRRG